MRKFWAIVLAGCLTLQSLPGYALSASAAESELVLAEESAEAVAAESGSTDGAEIIEPSEPSEDGFTEGQPAADAPAADNGLILEEIVPTDELTDYETESGNVQEAVTEAVGEIVPETEYVPETEAPGEAEPGTEYAPETEVSSEAEPGTEYAPESEPVSEPESETGYESESEPVSEPESETGYELESEPVSEPESGMGFESESEIVSEPESGSEFESGQEIIVEPGTETGLESESEILNESETETGSEPESEPESESEIEIGAEGSGGIQTLSLDEWDESYIEVKVVATLPFLDTENVTISLAPEDAAEGTTNFISRTVQIAVPNADSNALNAKTASASEKFAVAPGTYRVELHASQFADYTQVVNVAAHETSKIEVCTSKVVNEKGQSGWMRLGDVDGDGKITQEGDVDLILKGIRAASTDSALDLNVNGIVDLADLQFAVQSCGAGQEAKVMKLTVPHHAEHDDKTTIDGLDNLLYDNGMATLRRSNGEAISQMNPVAITFDFGTDAEGQTGTELEGMTLQAPVEQDQTTGKLVSDITGGLVTVEAEADGKTVYYEIPLIQGTEPNVQSPAEPEAASAQEEIALPAAVDVPDGDAGTEEGAAQNEAAAIMLMTAGVPLDAISVDSIEEIEEEEVPVEAAADAGQGIDGDTDGNGDGTSGKGQKEIKKLDPATLEMDGSFVLDFKGKIAVKRITISITGTKQKEPLAEIAKVQFVNNMEDRIPAPNLSIPQIKEIKPKNEELEVFWDKQDNVTGYEIEISGPVKKAEDQTQIVRVTSSPHTVTSINDKSLINFKDYKIRIRSVNGEWNSPWTQATTAKPRPEKGPDRVDNVTAKGGFRSLQVSWKDMDDANGYMAFYREKGAADYTPVVEGYKLPSDGVDRLTQNSCTITGLKDLTTYQVYVIAWNDYEGGTWGSNNPGEDGGPRVAEATTESGDTPRLPKYHLINTYGGSYDDKAEGAVGRLTDHIVSAVCGTNGSQKMMESALDQAKEAEAGTYPTVNGKTRQYARWALGTVDNSYASYWVKNDWDDGVAYPVGDFSKGVTVTFDQPYTMNYLTFTAADLQGNVETAQIVYWKDQAEIDADTAGESVGCSVVRNLDETNRPYYVVKFDEKITAQQVHLYIGTTYARIDLKIAEIHFHNYDEEVDGAVAALFADPEHSMLSEKLADLAATDKEAALAEIDRVQAIVETKDAATGEYHPLKDFLLLDLEGARELVNLQLDEPFYVDNTITAAKDGHLNFGGLNAWQPLGRVAAAGEKLIVYVGHNSKSIRQTANLQLICTQYHAESNALSKYFTLKVGKNEITIPTVTTTGGKERGGQLYVAYTGNNAKDQYVVRVNGGAKIPVLNLYNKSGADKKAAISTYVAELEKYVSTIQSEHERLHYNETEAANKDSFVYFPYKEQDCFLNATDLMSDHMMYSVPATQIWAAISKSTDKAAAVESGLDAMEKTMTLFYQHKGLFKGAGGNRETPAQHLNIRYMQMFSGAFMYASGNHIGVEFPETKLAMAGSWDGFGWGIAHEIGHDINDPNYAIAEITNNYFAQLLTKAGNADHATRFKYEDVYEKVTSGAIGRSPNGAVQLALYWQLHLAFDDYTQDVNGYRDDRYLFSDYQTMFDNLFFARVDTYSRNPGSAPKNKDKDKAVELKMVKDIDQNLMRLACAAAGKTGANILPFFERWGMVPDEDTRKFAEQYGDPVEKAYYYVNDDARNYRVDNKDNEDSLKVTDVIAKAEVDAAKTSENRVALKLSTDADEARKGAILGYEVVRSTYWRGRKQDAEVIGFTLADGNGEATYTDVIAALDNRVLYYEVRAVDKFLNYSKTSDTVSARVSTGGALGKNLWSVETTITAAEGQDKELRGDDHPDGGFDADSKPAVEYGIGKVIDNLIGDEKAGPFIGTAAADDRIVIDMQKPMAVTSVRYTGKALGPVTISVSSDGSNWSTVKENYEVSGPKDGAAFETIWFDAVQAEHKDSWIGTYDARYVRFIIHNAGAVEIDEIDICGPSGDDVSFNSDLTKAVGIVAEDWPYANENGKKLTIPAGALFFTGGYKGNPAYNMVMLYDDAEAEDGSGVRHGNVVGADLEAGEVYAEQIILADVPENGKLGETSDGSWIYFVTPPDKADWKDVEKVKKHSKDVYDGILSAGGGKVRAELYRVDNALTLEGERIVSDTAFLTLPESFDQLKEIKMPEQKQQAENR